VEGKRIGIVSKLFNIVTTSNTNPAVILINTLDLPEKNSRVSFFMQLFSSGEIKNAYLNFTQRFKSNYLLMILDLTFIITFDMFLLTSHIFCCAKNRGN